MFVWRKKMRHHIEKFLASRETRSRSTIAFYRTGLTRYRQFTARPWPPTAEKITAFLVAMRAEGLTAGTVHAYYRALRTFCNWQESSGNLKDNPIPHVAPPKIPHRKIPRAPARHALDTLFEHLEHKVEFALRVGKLSECWPDVRDMALFSFMFDTGVRVGEVHRLAIRDVDLARRTAALWETKDNAQRTVVFSDLVRADLSLWLDVRGELSVPASVKNMFVSFYRGRWGAFTHWGIRHRLRKKCAEAGLGKITPHQLRHAYAGRSLRAGADLEQVRQQLGHASLTTTTIYTMMDDSQRLEIHTQTSPRANLRKKY